MYAIFVLLAIALSVAPSTADKDECMRLGHPHAVHCCKSIKRNEDQMNAVKECFKNERPPRPPAPPTCDVDICVGQKLGYSDDKGKIDKKALEASMENEFKEDPALGMIKEKCINGDVTLYGPPEACDLMKIKHCVGNQLVLGCTEWDDKPHCAEIKQQAEECKA